MRYTAAQRSRDWQILFGMPEGRRAIADLLTRCGLFTSPVPAVLPVDPVAMAIGVGRQAVAYDIVQALQVTPAEFERIAEAMKETESG